MTSSKRSGRLRSNEYKIWLGKNPLTKWMRRTKTTQMEVAARVGVSTYAVYLWQHGTSVPTPDRFKKLGRLTKNKKIILEWAEWKQEYELPADKA